MNRIMFSKSTIFLILCLTVVGGIFIAWASRGLEAKTRWSAVILLCLIGIILISVFWSSRRVKIIGFAILFFVFGVWRYGASNPQINSNHIAYYNNAGRRILRGVVASADIREKSSRLTLNLIGDFGGKILVTTEVYPRYQYGDFLEIACSPEAPEKFEDFDYPGYLSRFDIYSVCYGQSDDIKKIASGKGNSAYAYVLAWKQRVQETIRQILPMPEASLLSGLVIGESRDLPQDIQDDFSRAGITHIIAVSGLNITLIASVVLALLLSLGLWRKHAFYGASIFLFFYILLIGAPASAVRAGIMGFLILLAQRLGRLSSAVNSIIFAGLVMLLINPKILLYDIGFQLSFAASLGIIYLQPIFQKIPEATRKKFRARFSKTIADAGEKPILQFLSSIICLTLAAQSATLPLTMYYFGRLSVIAPLANILVVPLITALTIWGFVSIILGMIYWFLGFAAGALIYFPLTYIMRVTHLLAKISYASLDLKMAGWMVAAYYLVLTAGAVWYNKKLKQ